MIMVLARNWWALALRGCLAILFGLAAFVLPGVTLAVLVMLFGAYNVIEGIASVLAGLVTFGWPVITAVILLYVIAFWAVVTGVFKIVSTIRIRRHLPGELVHGLNAVISVLFGLVLLIMPGLGLLAIVWWIGGYVIFRGLLLVMVALRLRQHGRQPLATKVA